MRRGGGGEAGAAAAAGTEAESVAALFERFRAPLFRYCVGRLRSREDAEDAVQETFLRAYGALRKGVRPDAEAAWLYKIAHNVCLTRLLARSRRGRVETPGLVEELAPAEDPPREELFGLEDALASMPPRPRQALLLREWQGLSYAEIAEELGTTNSAIETLIFRARRHLAEALRQPWSRVRKLLDGAGLVAALRSLLAGTGGKLAVAGAGLGIGAIAAGVVPLEHRPARHAPSPARPAATTGGSTAANAPVRPATSVAAHRSNRPARRSRPVATIATAPAASAPPRDVGASVHTTPATTSPAKPPAAVLPATTPVRPPTAPAPAAPLPDPVTTPATLPPLPASGTTTLPIPPLPQATTPSATTPTATVPVLTTPALTVPAAKLPSLPGQ